MKIGIASAGRFHALDLARELDHLGFEALFYSYVPVGRAERFGLPANCQRSLLPFVAPLVAWQNCMGNVFPGLQEKLMAHGLNRSTMMRLGPCDVFICMSGLYLEAAQYARRRYGAQVWLERGSRHVLSQQAILKECGSSRLPSDFAIERELAGYELADKIVVPSSHVAESFAQYGAQLMPKLFVNPYGVDLDQFPQHQSSLSSTPKTVLFVGSWSRRKGADILMNAIRKIDGARLLHVGTIVDVPFPDGDERFEHVEPVPQWRLKEYYEKAHVFALASREEGLALVQLQSLASGLPLVCTTRTGGQDLQLSPALTERISVVEAGDDEVFAEQLGDMLERATHANGTPMLTPQDREVLSWRAYGQRYCDELMRSSSLPATGVA